MFETVSQQAKELEDLRRKVKDLAAPGMAIKQQVHEEKKRDHDTLMELERVKKEAAALKQKQATMAETIAALEEEKLTGFKGQKSGFCVVM